MTSKKKKTLKICLFLLLLAAAVVITIILFPYAMRLKDTAAREAFRDRIAAFGVWGWLVMLLLQMVQVVFAVIPGEPVEILMGMLYGTVGGTLLCLLGILLGSMIIFFMVSRLGRAGIEKMMASPKYRKFKFLHDPIRRDSLMFVLFMIPGTPKDLITYFAPCTGINPLRFFVICTLSRIPSVVSSAYVGSSIADGNFLLSVIVFAVTAVLGLLGIWINDRYMARKNKEFSAAGTDAAAPPETDAQKRGK